MLLHACTICERFREQRSSSNSQWFYSQYNKFSRDLVDSVSGIQKNQSDLESLHERFDAGEILLLLLLLFLYCSLLFCSTHNTAQLNSDLYFRRFSFIWTSFPVQLAKKQEYHQHKANKLVTLRRSALAELRVGRISKRSYYYRSSVSRKLKQKKEVLR